MDQQGVVDAFLAGDAAALRERLGPDATFHSPVADYDERAGDVLTAVIQVIRAPRVTSALAGPQEAVAFFTAEIEGQRADGVLRAAGDEVTLMVRPLRTLLLGVERMKQLL